MKTKMKLVKWEVENKEVKPEIKLKQMIIPKIMFNFRFTNFILLTSLCIKL